MKNIKYYFIGGLVLVIAIIGYHFLAASHAEQQIDEAIQEQTSQRNTISVQYSEIDVAPFSADITINDLNIILGNHIERARQLKLDLNYLDFLNIYFGGVEYGLNHLDKTIINAISPSYTNKAELQEVKSDSLTITYQGNALDGIQSAVNGTPFSTDQSLKIRSSNITFSVPQTLLSTIKAQELSYSGSISKAQTNFWKEGSHHIRLDSLLWTPSESLQNKYSFFIKGFGYPTDAIPFQSAELRTKPVSQADDTLAINSTVKSELALLTSQGNIILKQPLEDSEFRDMQISLSDFSEKFGNVLNNIEQLLSITLPKSEAGITIQLQGSIDNPRVTE
ncbi:hypothetical protein CK503_14035 [Aliifodinibius salipaludis]|uniref:Uncharacterized protein n=1 Tax=Fodinibius salipaludis TaxID=2032627 RepID=A0A2A2G5I9_9BACT|nr:hypothetical protein [Aliifodinibius salipaludis]PAU93036.1 hypothetical protein CK503_14035 [Aliifodinibius salipaludis]